MNAIFYKRLLNLNNLLKQKSFFLFGPRATGKSFLVADQLPEKKVYDLLQPQTFNRLARSPDLIEEELTAEDTLIVIDEIQKLPHLLDLVHRLIEKKKIKFLLTGSSARKLRRGGANLLAGRAWQASLFPLVSAEIEDFNLERYLNRGGLPTIYPSINYLEELDAYTSLYLREEILAESLIRNIENFSRFIDILALSNGQEMNYESLGGDCGVSGRVVRSYLEILEDTLLGFQLPGFTLTKKRKAISRSKFYFFDIGVTNTLAKRGEVFAKSKLFGDCFEHFIILEIRAYLSYYRKKEELSYWRSVSQFEVDCIVGNRLAIEVKSTDLVQSKNLKGLKVLKEEGLIERYILVSLDPTYRKVDSIEVYPWKQFLHELWEGKLV